MTQCAYLTTLSTLPACGLPLPRAVFPAPRAGNAGSMLRRQRTTYWADQVKAPIFICDLELTEPISDIQLPPRADGADYNGVRLLVRVQRLPVGYVQLSTDE